MHQHVSMKGRNLTLMQTSLFNHALVMSIPEKSEEHKIRAEKPPDNLAPTA
jgi:hypothetical protein